MVIFGAGASFDSVSPRLNEALHRGVARLRPPLAKDLFSELFAPFVAATPEAAPVVAQMRLASLSGGDVERKLADLQAEVDTYPDRAAHVAAVRFYLHRLIAACTDEWIKHSAGITNYLLMVDQIAAWQRRSQQPVLFVTFNYDTMLEDALARTLPGWDQDLVRVMSRTDFNLFKPHGSISWGRRASLPDRLMLRAKNSDDIQRTMCRRYSELFVSDEFVLRRPNEYVRGGSEAPLLFPAIAIPVERKAHFECPPEHRGRFERLVAGTTRLVVVGWRATEQHFTEILQVNLPKNRKIPLHVVAESPSAVATTERNLIDATYGVSFVATHGGSSDGFSGFCDRSSPLESFLTDPTPQ